MGSKKELGRLRVAARATPKEMEKALLKKAEFLAEHPEVLLPVCRAKCISCPFSSYRKKLKSLSEKARSKGWMTFWSNWGNPVGKAYAGTMLLLHQGKIPYLANVRMPFGDFPYAVRGKAPKEILIGVQHYDHPIVRLLIVAFIARSAGVRVYSLEKEWYCTGKNISPPPQYIEECLGRMKGRLSNSEDKKNVYTCSHLKGRSVSKGESCKDSYLRLHWKEPDLYFARCRRCAKAHRENMLSFLISHMLSPDPKKEFEISIIARPECETECEKCLLDTHIDIEKDALKSYLELSSDDGTLMEKTLSSYSDRFFELEEKVFIIDRRCYGVDKAGFSKAMRAEGIEKDILNALLDILPGPVIADTPSVSKLLAKYWPVAGKELLRELTGSKKISAQYFSRADHLKDNLVNVVRTAREEANRARIEKELPKLKLKSEVSRFTDAMGRLARIKGLAEMHREMEETMSDDPKIRGIAYGFTVVAGAKNFKQWYYTESERDVGEHLAPLIKKLVECPKEEYAPTLQEIIRATGSFEEIEVIGNTG